MKGQKTNISCVQPHRPERRMLPPWEDFCALHNEIASCGKVEWINNAARELVERYMPDQVDRLPDKRTETFDQAFGRVRAKAKRKVTGKQGPKGKSHR